MYTGMKIGVEEKKNKNDKLFKDLDLIILKRF